MNTRWRKAGCIALFLMMFMVASHADAAATRSYQYDASGRLLSITAPTYKITYVYDKNGNLIKRTTVSLTTAKASK